MCIYHPFIEFSISVSNSQPPVIYFHKEFTVLLNEKCIEIPPSTMLSYLVIHNSFVSEVYLEDISDISCQIYLLNILQRQNCRELPNMITYLMVVFICISLLVKQ